MSGLYMNTQAQEEAKKLSQEILAPIRAYQRQIGLANANQSHTLVILGAIGFVVGVIIGRLPRKSYDEAIDFMRENEKKIREELRP